MWGANGSGQLGIQSNVDSNIPVKVNNSSSTLPEKSVKYVALGSYHSAAITKDGSLYMWGYNNYGQLGNGSTTNSYTPVKIMENVAAVSLGSYHSAAITKDGSLYMWGYNNYGQLGNGSTTNSYTPVKIMENVAAVSLGSYHSAAITKDGSLYMWGYNNYGQLGNGSSGNYEKSVSPIKIMENVAAVSLGRWRSAAITKDGSLYMWGWNRFGELGNGTTNELTRPQRVAANVQSVELGNYHTTAVSKDGGLYTWGYNNYGQLGNGTTNNSYTPVKIMSDVVSSAGGSHTIALKKNGTVYTWGDNEYGELGNGNKSNQTSPVAIQIYDRTNVLTANGIKYGVVPDNGGYSFTPTGEITQIAAGHDHSAAVTKDGDLYMWGANGSGQLGIQSNVDSNIPVKVNNSSSTLPEKSVKYVALGSYHSAAITKDGSLYMWGYNNYGQLGNGSTTNSYTPVKIMENVAAVSLGSYHSAAITKDGSLYMWGYNNYGQLGNGSTTNSYTPVKIMENVAAVSLGSYHSAAITKDGSLYMWGYNNYGQLGNGSSGNYEKSVSPIKIMENVAAVSLGCWHSAAITKDGSLYMWGYNNYGQLGNGTTNNLTRPQRIAVNVQSVELGNYHTTAVSKDGGLYTWGYNNYGQLGNGTTNNSYTPVKIMSDVVSSAGGSHTIALKKNGTVYTWGDNEYGELGNGNKSNQTSPVAIQIYDRTNVLRAKQALEPVGASSAKHTTKLAGYKANGIYNFYSLKDKNVNKLLTDDNVLYVDQVRADANGNISVTYTPKADCDTPYEFVASITQINLSNAEVTAENLTYNGKTQAVKPVVKVNDYTLYEGIDYTLTGAYEAKNVGEYTYTIVGKGDFVGYTTKTFTINNVDVNDCKVSSINSVPYSGKEIKPDVAVSMDGYTLAKDIDYTVEYQNNLNVGIGIVVIKGIGNFTGRNICWFDITRCDISTIPKIVVKNCEYSGKAVVPEMILENNGIALVKDKDYTVTFKNNTSVGTATAIISGIGNYSGTVEKAFTIGNTMVGDVDMNGKVDVNDVTLIMKYNVDLINLSSEQLKFADVNEDDYVDILDATLLQQYIANCVS